MEEKSVITTNPLCHLSVLIPIFIQQRAFLLPVDVMIPKLNIFWEVPPLCYYSQWEQYIVQWEIIWFVNLYDCHISRRYI